MYVWSHLLNIIVTPYLVNDSSHCTTTMAINIITTFKCFLSSDNGWLESFTHYDDMCHSNYETHLAALNWRSWEERKDLGGKNTNHEELKTLIRILGRLAFSSVVKAPSLALYLRVSLSLWDEEKYLVCLVDLICPFHIFTRRSCKIGRLEIFLCSCYTNCPLG